MDNEQRQPGYDPSLARVSLWGLWSGGLCALVIIGVYFELWTLPTRLAILGFGGATTLPALGVLLALGALLETLVRPGVRLGRVRAERPQESLR